MVNDLVRQGRVDVVAATLTTVTSGMARTWSWALRDIEEERALTRRSSNV
jgi:hypothetical protein